jgi:hypothetical protein
MIKTVWVDLTPIDFSKEVDTQLLEDIVRKAVQEQKQCKQTITKRIVAYFKRLFSSSSKA